MHTYCYTFVLGDARDGAGTEQQFIFKGKDDQEAIEKVENYLKEAMNKFFGGHLIKGKLEKGTMIPKRIKIFQGKKTVELDIKLAGEWHKSVKIIPNIEPFPTKWPLATLKVDGTDETKLRTKGRK